jgi:hypothetical protein
MTSEVQWNKKNLGKWIKSLRDPKKKQTNGTLMDRKGMCCLGVVSKISRIGKFNDYGTFEDTVVHDENGHTSSTCLTDNVQKWLGADRADPNLSLGDDYSWESLYDRNQNTRYSIGRYVSCTEMNDNWDLTFPQIADMLEYFIYNNLPDAE